MAVHCRAGLGRTGTLVALWLMRRAGFTARAAIGWLRLVRPGSVLGPQQPYLCASEARAWRGNELLPPPPPMPHHAVPQDSDRASSSGLGLRPGGSEGARADAASMAAQITATMRARGAARAGCSGGPARVGPLRRASSELRPAPSAEVAG